MNNVPRLIDDHLGSPPLLQRYRPRICQYMGTFYRYFFRTIVTETLTLLSRESVTGVVVLGSSLLLSCFCEPLVSFVL